MKKIFFTFYLLFITLVLSGCTLPEFPWQKEALGALQVTSVPQAEVFLDDKDLGKTPYYDEKLPVGEHTLRLASDVANLTTTWQAKIKLTPRVLTVVSRDLGPTELLSDGHVISLEPLPDASKSEINVISTPTGAQVTIADNNLLGSTPIGQSDIKPGEHTINITLAGFRTRSVKIQTIKGYRLLLNVQLSQALVGQPADLLATASAVPATSSGQPVSPSPSINLPAKPRIKVLDTPTGWLNVRFGPSLGATISARINPGEYYPYEDEQAGWIKIKYNNGQNEGWVSSTYVEKQL